MQESVLDDPRPALRARLQRWAEERGRPLDDLLREIRCKEGQLTTEEKLVLSDYHRSQALRPYATDSVTALREIRRTE